MVLYTSIRRQQFQQASGGPSTLDFTIRLTGLAVRIDQMHLARELYNGIYRGKVVSNSLTTHLRTERTASGFVTCIMDQRSHGPIDPESRRERTI